MTRLIISFSTFLSLLTLSLAGKCNLCYEKDIYPLYVNKIIVARYVGEYTCGVLYQRGQDGLIPDFMCGPLQDYVQEPCGCDPSNLHPSQYSAPSGPPQTLHPAFSYFPAYNTPVATPTRRPTPYPTQPPGALPIRKVPEEGSKNDLKLAGGRNELDTYGVRGRERKLLSQNEPIEVVEEEEEKPSLVVDEQQEQIDNRVKYEFMARKGNAAKDFFEEECV